MRACCLSELDPLRRWMSGRPSGVRLWSLVSEGLEDYRAVLLGYFIPKVLLSLVRVKSTLDRVVAYRLNLFPCWLSPYLDGESSDGDGYQATDCFSGS